MGGGDRDEGGAVFWTTAAIMTWWMDDPFSFCLAVEDWREGMPGK
jgi:hypothetical protein